MARKIIFGEIPGIEEGHVFENRKEMMPSAFHRNWAVGIDGNKTKGSAAIVLSGGYEDDMDMGDEIIYTGAGGNDPNTKKQVKDQSWENTWNAGLLLSMNQGLPVRVIRGHTHRSEYSPQKGYVYAGLYSVVDAWQDTGKNGFKICRFRLVYSGENVKRKSLQEIEIDYTQKPKKRAQSTVLRIVRDSKIAFDIKRLYNFECQVCGFTIQTQGGRYAEGAHIKGLGKPHNGEDNSNNLLCLCPNHHTMFDKGVFSINDDLTLLGEVSGTLKVHPKHKINKEYLFYHRKAHGYD